MLFVPKSATMLLLSALLVITAAGQEGKKSKTTKGKTVKELAVVETSLGTFEIELYGKDAPKTVENFKGLVAEKFFDGMRVHRVAKGFVIQTGDDKSKDTLKMAEWGSGGKSIWGKEFADELDSNAPSYKAGYLRGTVAMANRGPNTNTSQFFVMLKDVPYMPKNYSIFGRVDSGMEIVDKIGAAEIIPLNGPSDGRPKTEIIVKSIRLKAVQPTGK
jgi:cyclophilin family peptidyl-prolyl cis-trans isomerase